MSETKTPWTPGTWQVVEDRDNGTDYYWITTKELLPHNPVDHEWAITNKADAYLIAAAPSLYEALEELLAAHGQWMRVLRIKSDPDSDDGTANVPGADRRLFTAIQNSQAALALAKGETK